MTENERIDQEVAKHFDSFIDPKFDYTKIFGRVTDKDESGTVFKIASENKNIRFLKAGDLLTFKVDGSKKDGKCEASLRASEDGYFIIYVKNIYPCWSADEYFRRGTKLEFDSHALAKRVKDASFYRAHLMREKRTFLSQLASINNFIWNYDEKRIKKAAEFDKQILAIEQQKQRELDLLMSKKKDQIVLQKDLQTRLDSLDQDLKFYKVDPVELIVDRWGADQNLGLPLEERPSELKKE